MSDIRTRAAALNQKTDEAIVKMTAEASLAFAIAGVIVLFCIGLASQHCYHVSRAVYLEERV